jgi:cytochrome c-type biogenesis protein CcmF
MIPEIGQLALALAFVVALAQGTVPLVGAHRGDAALMGFARRAALIQFGLVAIAFGCLAASFLNSDFSVLNVAQNSFTTLPAQYKLAASWGSHEGSLLLWALMLAGWSAAVALRSRNLPAPMLARGPRGDGPRRGRLPRVPAPDVEPVRAARAAGARGPRPQPLLQDPGMVIHPPLLYMGYVGFSVAFSFAIAALIGGRLDASWARWSRPWTTVAWCFLTLGIMLGSAWAYYELGWGGWWFWDPVENASFMPWLVGTALIHSLAVTEKRGTFKSWTVLLAIVAFSLSLLGTFLVRSGVLTSVHAFATDPARGVFVLAFLVIVIGGSLTLYAARAGAVGGGASFAPVSRESMLLANNLLLDRRDGERAARHALPAVPRRARRRQDLGRPALLRGRVRPADGAARVPDGCRAGRELATRRAADAVVRLRWALGVAIACALVLPFVLGRWSPLVAAGLFLALWVVAATVSIVVQRFRTMPRATFTEKLRANASSWYGMLLAHLGIAVFIVGVTLVKGYESSATCASTRARPSRSGAMRSCSRASWRTRPELPGARRHGRGAAGGELIEVLHPEKRIYRASGQTMTEAAIDTRVAGDLYVSLGEPVTETGHAGAWGVRIYVKPFIDWIWGGCVLMALGGFLAVADRRYRIAIRERVGAALAAARA